MMSPVGTDLGDIRRTALHCVGSNAEWLNNGDRQQDPDTRRRHKLAGTHHDRPGQPREARNPSDDLSSGEEIDVYGIHQSLGASSDQISHAVNESAAMPCQRKAAMRA